MKINKIQIASLLLLSILSIKWMPHNNGLHAKAGKNIQSFEHVANRVSLPGTNLFINYSGITLNYTKLKLTKEKYNQLASNQNYNSATANDRSNGDDKKKSGIVFQFFYLSPRYPYPTLKAYPMTLKDRNVIFGTPLNLEYLIPNPSPDLSVCNEQVTGDLRVTFYDMEFLKAESNPNNAEAYQYFLFTPKYDDSTQHVYFEVKVFPATNPGLIPKSKDIKPSPPY